MDAKITIEFIAKNICDEDDLEDCHGELDVMVKNILDSEGLFGIVEDDYKILKIEREA